MAVLCAYLGSCIRAVSLPGTRLLDCLYKHALAIGPKTIAVVTSKFPSAEDMAKGMRTEAGKRGLYEVAFLEYETGNLDYGPISARVIEDDPDIMFVGCLGVEGNQLLEALAKIGYSPKRHFYLYPSAAAGGLRARPLRATSLTNFEDVAPYISSPEAAEFAKGGFDRTGRQGGRAVYRIVDCPAGQRIFRLADHRSRQSTPPKSHR